MTINDVLPLKAARCNAIANLRCFSVPRDTNSVMPMGPFTFTVRRQLVWLKSAPFTSSRLAKFGWAPFAVCNAWQLSRMQNLRSVGEISGPIFTRLLTKVYEIFRRCRKPFVLCNALARLSTSRFFQKIFAIKPRNRRETVKSSSQQHFIQLTTLQTCSELMNSHSL